jgi:light-regulated signal transduction histidine kinase (bacteriophytochrome)
MAMLIDSLLEYARIRSQGAPLARCDSRLALQHALDNLRSAIGRTQAVITSDGLGDVLADSTQLTQLFQNLIGNALKFCDKQPPQVRVTAETGPQLVTFSVSDNGIGISPRDFGRIFTIFQRLHAREAYAGTGIGLAICQQIVQRHGGRIWVESKLGEGSTFYFTLQRPAGAA